MGPVSSRKEKFRNKEIRIKIQNKRDNGSGGHKRKCSWHKVSPENSIPETGWKKISSKIEDVYALRKNNYDREL